MDNDDHGDGEDNDDYVEDDDDEDDDNNCRVTVYITTNPPLSWISYSPWTRC